MTDAEVQVIRKNWGQFKAAVESQGVRDEMPLDDIWFDSSQDIVIAVRRAAGVGIVGCSILDPTILLKESEGLSHDE